MPLVTRTTVSGNVYRQATEPSDWQNGDLWVDTDNGQVYVNVNGTATLVQLAAVTANRLLVSDSAGVVAASSVTSTEAGYVSGVTSAIQTQLGTKVTSGGALGTPSSGTLTSCTGLPITGITSSTSAQLKTLISDETGSGALVFATSPTLVTPVLGTPTSGDLTNCTNKGVKHTHAANTDADGGLLALILHQRINRLQMVTPAISANWLQSTTGTATIAFTYTANSNIIKISTGATTASVGEIGLPMFLNLAGDCFFTASVDAGVTTNYRMIMGLFESSPTADTQNGFGFVEDVTTAADGNCVNGNGSASTTTTLGTRFSTLAAYMAVRTGASILFYRAGTLIATHTTNLPVSGLANFKMFAKNSENADKDLTLRGGVITSGSTVT